MKLERLFEEVLEEAKNFNECPKTRKEMLWFMNRIGISEDSNFHQLMVEWGWFDTEEEAQAYLESLDITPWDD